MVELLVRLGMVEWHPRRECGMVAEGQWGVRRSQGIEPGRRVVVVDNDNDSDDDGLHPFTVVANRGRTMVMVEHATITTTLFHVLVGGVLNLPILFVVVVIEVVVILLVVFVNLLDR